MSVRRTFPRPLVRGAALATATAGLTLIAGPALAHVSVSPGEAGAGDYAIATFSIPHGCDEAATTKVTINIPESIPRVTPTRNPLWEVSKTTEKLATPIQPEEGDAITERVAAVVYTAKTPLPDGIRDAFELSFQIPETVGEKLTFPVIQVCEGGKSTEWTQTVAEGEAEPERPAPVITVVEGSGGDHHGGSKVDQAADEKVEEADEAASKSLAYSGLGVGVAGLLVAAAALVKSRKA